MTRVRPSMEAILMNFAMSLAKRSTCARLHVGAVLADAELLHVLGVGYNGNAAGLSNTCDSPEPGHCGCVHAELNALLKRRSMEPGTVLFTTTSPCVACAKAIINAGVARVVYGRIYRDATGLGLLERAGVQTHYAPADD